MRAKLKESNIEYEVRKMTDEEMDNSFYQHYCSDETGHIFKEEELRFLEQQDETPQAN